MSDPRDKPYNRPGIDPIEFIRLVGEDEELDIAIRQKAWDYLDDIRTGRAWEEPLPDIPFLARLCDGAYRGGGPQSYNGLIDYIEKWYGPATRLAVLHWIRFELGPAAGGLH
jgi:hypothetical protein